MNSATNLEKEDDLFSINTFGESYSSIFPVPWPSCPVISVFKEFGDSLSRELNKLQLPSSRTNTRSLSMTVGIRWATVSTVHLPVSSLIACWITLSVAVSIEAVASSRTKILLFWRSTRAKQTSCLCPTLQFSPSSATAGSRTPKQIRTRIWIE